MLNFKTCTYLFICILLVNLANAATIYGTIYDLSLKKVNNAQIEIDTSPKQFLIARNGSYSFNVPNGNYTIKAQLKQKDIPTASAEENITIKQDGSYVLDLILFPDIEEGIEDINADINENIPEIGKSKANALFGFVILPMLALILIGLIGYYYFKKIRKQGKIHKDIKADDNDNDNELEQLIKIIKGEGGRATQKEIRKQIPLSEAKISLMISELEHKGLIEKIKKGRGNIIILKK